MTETKRIAMSLPAEDPIRFTDNALNKIKNLIEKDPNPNVKLRVYIIGGGCSGFQYGFKLDAAVNDDDILIQKENIAVVVDAMSAQYLEGAEIDYIENLQGARFSVQNPQAETTCGCGASFSLK
jgi:iron-sulfur cluster insertion protein